MEMADDFYTVKPMFDSSLPWKEKRKLIQAEIDRKKKAAIKKKKELKAKNGG
jgi:hypothetical protein